MTFLRRISRWFHGRLCRTIGHYGMLFTCAVLGGIVGCGDDGDSSAVPLVAVVSAMPAELAPLVARAEVKQVITIDRWRFRRATLAGQEVVLLVTGIGAANASSATRRLLERFAVRGLVVSGVAGSSLPIGDVIVPQAWRLPDGSTFSVSPGWYAIASRLAGRSVPLDRCTEIPDRPEQPPVCLDRIPVVRTLGLGLTTDRFGNQPLNCQPNGGDVFGCDVDSEPLAQGGTENFSPRMLARETTDQVVAEDMETAAIAREAARAGVPFIAFRGVSDGAADPLGLPGFPAQFFTYYRLAARNAANVTVAFLERL